MAKPKMDFKVEVVFGQLLHIYSTDLIKAVLVINKIEGLNYVTIEGGRDRVMAMVSPLYSVDEVKEEIEDKLSIAFVPEVFKDD